MSEKIKRELRKARPSLRLVSPLAHWTVLVMAVFNLFLGAALWLAIDEHKAPASYIIVNSVLTFHFWGVVFFGIGLLKLYALITNNWGLARHSLFVGVAIKAMWAVALTIRTFISPGTAFLNITWITVALLQMGAYVWFVPPQHLENGVIKDE